MTADRTILTRRLRSAPGPGRCDCPVARRDRCRKHYRQRSEFRGLSRRGRCGRGKFRMALTVSDFLPGRPNIRGERRRHTAPANGCCSLVTPISVHVDGWREHWAGTEREDPFGAPVVDGQIWGRGAGDLKAGICSSLAALSSARQQPGIRLERRCCLRLCRRRGERPAGHRRVRRDQGLHRPHRSRATSSKAGFYRLCRADPACRLSGADRLLHHRYQDHRANPPISACRNWASDALKCKPRV